MTMLDGLLNGHSGETSVYQFMLILSYLCVQVFFGGFLFVCFFYLCD